MKLKRLAFEHARRGRLQAARRWFGGCLLLAAANAGCLNDAAMVPELQQQTMDLENRLAACNRELAARDAQIADLRRRVNDRPVLDNVAVDDLFTVDRIEIVSRSGGADFDGQPGDDGVVIYVRPLDADGDVLKAAGRFTIQLLDLTDPGAPRTLFQYESRGALGVGAHLARRHVDRSLHVSVSPAARSVAPTPARYTRAGDVSRLVDRQATRGFDRRDPATHRPVTASRSGAL
jgi:hypothetical protein